MAFPVEISHVAKYNLEYIMLSSMLQNTSISEGSKILLMMGGRVERKRRRRSNLENSNGFPELAEQIIQNQLMSNDGNPRGSDLVERETRETARAFRPSRDEIGSTSARTEYHRNMTVSDFHRLVNRVYRHLHVRKTLFWQDGDLFIRKGGCEGVFFRKAGYFLPYYDAATLFISLVLDGKRLRARQWIGELRERMIATGRYDTDHDSLFVSLGWCLLLAVTQLSGGEKIPSCCVRGIIEKDIELIMERNTEVLKRGEMR